MATVPEHDAALGDPLSTETARPTSPTYATDEAGDDIYVEGQPWELPTEEPQEVTRRTLAALVVASYTMLTAMGLGAVAFAESDAQAIMLILTPYGTLVTGVVAYYFLKVRR